MHTHTQSWVSMVQKTARLIAILSCVAMVLGSLPSLADAAAGVPRIMNYQGRLMSSGGTLLGGSSGTDYCVKFSLYDDSAVGGADTKLWPAAAPSTMTVTVRNGVFNAGVGDTNAGGDTLDFNFEDTDAIYLNVEVATKVGATCAAGDGAESFENLSPRQRVTASGYAINSATLGGKTGAYYLANSYSTTSAAYDLSTFDKGFFFSTTSADVWATTLSFGGFSTSSADYWKTQTNFYSTSSTAYDLSTYDKGFFFSTTSVAYWDSTQFRWATTSTDAWFATKSTDDLDEGVSNLYYADSRVASYINASSTIPNRAGGSFGDLLSWTGSSWTPSATSSLGLPTFANLASYLSVASWYATTTDALDEGITNLYFTSTRFASELAATTTDALAEGSTNRYYQDSRVQTYLDGIDTGFFFSTTSAMHFASAGLAFSTTSVDAWASTQSFGGFSTSSADYWKTQTNFYSTSSTAYDLSTYDKGFFFSTTSVAYWDSTQFRWATTSTDAWFATKSTDDLDEGVSNLYYTPARVAGVIAGTTTDALAEGSVNKYFTNGLANSFIGASTTIPKTFTNNTFTGTNSFDDVTAINATTTNIASQNATTSNLNANTASVGSATIGSLTLGNALSGTNGGTGLGTVTQNALLIGGAGNTWTQISTSSLGLATYGDLGAYLGLAAWYATTTDALAEGSTNRYFTTNRLATALAATTTDAIAEGVTNKYFTDNRVAGVIAGTTTDALAEGATNKYYADGLVQTYLDTIPKPYFFATSSAAFNLATYDKGFFFSTTSVAYWDSTQFRWATTSTDAWFATKSTDDLDEGVSNRYYASNLFAADLSGTTTDALDEGVTNFYFTNNRAQAFLNGVDKGYFFSSTSAAYYSAQNPGASFSTTSADYYVNASSTIPKTYSNNTYTGTNNFQDTTAANATSTSLFATTASSSNLFSSIANIGSLVASVFTGNVITAVNATTTNFYAENASTTHINANTSNTGSATIGSLTLGNALSGTNGGTGLGTVTQNALLIGGAGNTWTQISTSSLGLATYGDLGAYLGLAAWYATTTDALAEGSTNRYFTTNRLATALAATTTDAIAEGVTNKYFTDNRVAGVIAGTTTDALAEGSVNRYYSNGLVDAHIGASSTVAKAFTNNTFTGVNAFAGITATGATTTSLSTGIASTSNLIVSNIQNSMLYTGAGGVVTGATISGPLSFSVGTLSIQQASVLQDGYLSAADYTSFNSRLSTSSLGTLDKGFFFSTTSTDYWKDQTSFFSTSSTDFWKTQNNFFSTTSASHFTALGLAFSTTSTAYFLAQNQGNAFSTTSASNFAAAGLAFSTTSAAYFTSQNQSASFSTTSTDYWKSQNNFFSTTSASVFLTLNQGNAFSTTSAAFNLSTYDKGFFFSTTSVAYWDSTQFRWATTSSDAWFATKSTDDLPEGTRLYYTEARVAGVIAGTTTDALAEGSVNRYYSNGLVDAHVGASTTIAKTFTNNTFTGVNAFGNITATGATTTVLSTGIASTTNLTVSSIQNSMLYTGPGGVVTGTTISGPLSFNTGTLSIQQASDSQSGYLSLGDYSSFNSRLSTSSLGTIDTGFFFSTTSSDFWKTQTSFFSTSSTDFWKTQNNFFSTTSASHFTSLGLSFSTTSAAAFLGLNQGTAFSTTSASYFVVASTSIPKTYTDNTFIGVNAFADITASNATTTSLFSSFSSSTEARANTASFGSATIGALNTIATTTGSNGFNISSGCFAVNGECIANGSGGGAAGVLVNIQTFTADGTYTPSAGATSAQVIVTGGGGGGGGILGTDTTNETIAGGGGAGGTAIAFVDVTATTSVQVVVGSGGSAGANTGGDGGAGGTSAFSTFASAAGGIGGGGSAVNATGCAAVGAIGVPGSGGGASGGDLNVSGGNAFHGSCLAEIVNGGSGGSSYWGGGASGAQDPTANAAVAGTNASAYGAGGGGAAEEDAVSGALGGAGAGGIVVVYEYGPFDGVMNIANGGTGTSTAPAYGEFLVGNGAGGYSLLATSSLGFATTTDGLNEGTTNLYYADDRVDAYVNASSTIVKSFASNIFNTLQTFADVIFGNATSTNMAVTGTASTSDIVVSNGFTFGRVTGILKATAGVVASALVDLANDVTGVLGIANGGTGTSTAPTLGQLLVGNAASGYDLVATSTLGIYISDTTGTLDETRGGTGNTSYAAGDILYALNSSTLVPLPAGGNGSVLKIAGGLPAWGTDLQGGGGGGGGGGGFFSTTTDDLAIFPSNPTYAVIVGNSATTTEDATLEVFGKSYFSNRMGIATSSPGSIFSIGNVGNFSSLGSTLYSKLNLLDVEATGNSTFAGVVAASLAASNVGANALSAGTTATTTIQGDATGTSTIQGFINVLGTNSTSTFSGSLQALSIGLSSTSTAAGFDMTSGCYAINGVCTVNTLTATNTTLTTTGTNGAIGISLNLSNPNVWSGLQQFGTATSTLFESMRIFAQTIQSTSTNALVLQSNFSSTAGLTFGSTSTPQVLGIDTINNRVTLGTGGATPSLLVLDNKNTPGDPTGVAGAQYYNSNTDEFRCFATSWVTCGGQAASSTGDVQFRNVDGSFAATANFNWSQANNRLALQGNSGQQTEVLAVASSTGNTVFSVNGAGVIHIATTTDPGATSSGLDLYAKAVAGRVLPKWTGPSGIDVTAQPALFGNNITMWFPNTTTVVSIAMGSSWTARKSGTGAAQSTPVITGTSLYTSMKRALFSTGTTATGTSGTQSSQLLAWRGNSAGLGGFFYFARVGVDTTYDSTVQLMTGLSALNAVLAGEPSAQNNSILLGKDSTDTTWQIITRSGTAATKTDTGLTIAAGQVMDFYIFASPNDTKVTVRVVEQTASGPSIVVDDLELTTDLPVNTTFMYAQHRIRSTAGTTAKGYALNRIYVETDI